MSYKIVFTKRAVADIQKLKSAGIDAKAKKLVELLRENPYQSPPTFEKLQGDLQGAFLRRINIKHRLVYQAYEQEKVVKVISLWSHYEF